MRKNYVYLLFTIFFFFSACQEDDQIDDLAAKGETNWSIRLNQKGGFLEFRNDSIFQNTLETLDNKPYNEVESWTKQYEFYSLANLYNEALQKEASFTSELENLVLEGKLSPEEAAKRHAPLVMENASSFIFSEEGYFDINLFDPTIATLVNKDGIIKIGNNLVRFTFDHVIELPGGSADNISSLKNTDKASLLPNVIVNKVHHKYNLAETGIEEEQLNNENSRIAPNSWKCSKTRIGLCGRKLFETTVRLEAFTSNGKNYERLVMEAKSYRFALYSYVLHVAEGGVGIFGSFSIRQKNRFTGVDKIFETPVDIFSAKGNPVATIVWTLAGELTEVDIEGKIIYTGPLGSGGYPPCGYTNECSIYVTE